MQRRRATWGAGRADDGLATAPVSLWQRAFNVPGIYDLGVPCVPREAMATVHGGGDGHRAILLAHGAPNLSTPECYAPHAR
jgi:hypothetical protein